VPLPIVLSAAVTNPSPCVIRIEVVDTGERNLMRGLGPKLVSNFIVAFGQPPFP
jgi:hypothetical protein